MAAVARTPRRARSATHSACSRGSSVVAVVAAALIAFFVARFGVEKHAQPQSLRPPTIEYDKLSSTPLVYLLSGLLSSEECDELVALGGPRMRPSEMGAAGSDPAGDEDQPASNRTSWSMFFDTPVDADEPLLTRLRQRWAEAARAPLSQAEPTQLSRYAQGQSYGLHLDASEEVPRRVTLLTYLSDVSSGGETTFPRIAPDASAASVDAGGLMRPLAKLAAAGLLSKELANGEKYCSTERAVLRVAPRKGDGLLFFPLHPDGTADHDAVHGGCAVRGRDDVKWIAQQWFTYSNEVEYPTEASSLNFEVEPQV